VEHHLLGGLDVARRAVPGANRVVLVHGTMDRASSLRKVARRLPDLDVTVYDRRGYGGSVAGGVAPTIEAHVDDLFVVLGDEAALVVGHSLGGIVALGAAARRPDLIHGVLSYEAPVAWCPWWPPSTAGSQAVYEHPDEPAVAAEAFMRRMIGDARWERLPEATRRARRAEGPALLAEMKALRSDGPPFDPATISVPVLVAAGTSTSEHHRRGAVELAALLPSATLVELEGAGHGAHLTHPDGFAQLVRRALPDGDSPRLP
jgi:pimeloyl-ACP methyl ester carboxylesterase